MKTVNALGSTIGTQRIVIFFLSMIMQHKRYRYDIESGRLRQREPGGAYDYDAGGRTTEDGR